MEDGSGESSEQIIMPLYVFNSHGHFICICFSKKSVFICAKSTGFLDIKKQNTDKTKEDAV